MSLALLPEAGQDLILAAALLSIIANPFLMGVVDRRRQAYFAAVAAHAATAPTTSAAAAAGAGAAAAAVPAQRTPEAVAR